MNMKSGVKITNSLAYNFEFSFNRPSGVLHLNREKQREYVRYSVFPKNPLYG